MKEHVVHSLAEPVGLYWRKLQEQYTKDGEFVVAAPLSSTPIPVYRWIIDHADTFPNWNNVRFLLMDEQIESDDHYVQADDPASYEGFARRHFIDPLQKKISLPDDFVKKPSLNHLNSYNPKIHLLILAMGVSGNYANVMPGTNIETGWHISRLLPEFRSMHTQAGSGSFPGAAFRDFGMSLGPQQVLDAEHVVIIISGEKKQELVKRLKSYTSFDSEFPLSIINHPKVRDRVTVYFTEDAI